MAIKNASDLLVYKKTSPAQAQVTRIKVKSSTPLKDFTSGQNIIINNITDASGDITDGETDDLYTNSGAHITSSVKGKLEAKGYTVTNVSSSDSFHFIDATNGANGPVPTLELVNDTAEFKEGAVEIVVLTPGQSLVYQPIAFSTSASVTMTTDLRDISTKDSLGWQENAKGVASFEMSTDALWDVNNAVGVESATTDLIQGDSVDVKFSDRVRNLVATEEVYGEGWTESLITKTKHLEDPFSQFTAAKIEVISTGSSRFTSYTTPIQLVEGKKVTWSLYLKAFSATANACVLRIRSVTTSTGNEVNSSIKIISGSGTVTSVNSSIKKITGLSTSSWTKVELTADSVISGTDLDSVFFYLYPGADYTNQTTADKVITASWQVETGTTASDYQNPTEVDCYQGKAFVNSVSIDAGTEENATYSASFTGTSEIFVNGLGHELLGDPYFDGTETTVGPDKFLVPNWKLLNSSSNATSNFSDGVAKLIWTSNANTYLVSHTGSVNINPMVVGKKYELTYTVSTYVSGDLKLTSTSGDPTIPVAEGTHTLRFTADSTELLIRRADATSGEIHITYLSLKEVFS